MNRILRSRSPYDAARLTAAVAMVVLAVYYLLLSDAFQRDVIYDTWNTGAAILVGLGVVLHRTRRPWPWMAIAVGLALVAAGDWTWTLLDHLGEDPFPSVADGFYLGGEALMVVGLVWLGHERMPRGDRASLLDALILATGFGLLAWIYVIDPIAESGGTPVNLTFSLAYPLLDVAMLGVLARLLFTPGPRVMSFWLLAAAVTAYLVGDLGFSYLDWNGLYEAGHPIDAAWLVGGLLFALAALHPSMVDVTEPAPTLDAQFTRRRLATLAVASLMAPLVLLLMSASGESIDAPVIAAGSIALFLLVLARLDGVVADLRHSLAERRQLEDELKRQALHDPLTGLANRALFGDRLGHALAKRTQRVGVLFLDLDDFKTVNDTLGHDAGDELLVALARRLRSAVRPGDTAARLGGDEFAVLLDSGADLRVASSVAERLLAAVSEPLEIAGRPLAVRASVGISLGVAGETDPAALMREADVAMYTAKGMGKGRYAVFDPAAQPAAAASATTSGLRVDLEGAIARDGFELLLQPILELTTGRPVAVRASLAWDHPARGRVPAETFRSVAERTGLIGPLTARLLDGGCRAVLRLRAQLGEATLGLGVDLSPVLLSGSEAVEVISAALERTGFTPAALTVAVPQSAMVDRPSVTQNLRRLNELGVKVMIADLGTGSAPLGQLAVSPVDGVRIDRSVVSALAAAGRPQVVAAAVIQLCESLGLDVVADGVESAQDAVRLRAAGCTVGQGPWLAPIATEDAIVRALAGNEPGTRRNWAPGIAANGA